MTERLDIDRRLDSYLAPTDDRLADRVIEGALLQIETTPQAGTGLPSPWRPFVNTPLRASLAAVAAVIVLGAALLVSSQRPSVGGPPGGSATPSLASASTSAPTPPASLGAGPSPRIAGATIALSGPLVDGVTYVLGRLDPPFTFVGTSVLHLIGDSSNSSGFEAANSADEVAFIVPVAVYDEHGQKLAPPADLAAWFKARTDITATSSPVQLGSAKGTLVVGTLSATAHTNTAGGVNVLCANGYTKCNFEEGGQIGFLPGTRFEFLFATVAGKQIVFEADAPPADWATVGPAFDAFLRSIRFPG